MTRLSLFNSPLLLGFDHFERVLDRVAKMPAEGYPPYNIEQTGENRLRITLAVAGFTENDLSIQIDGAPGQASCSDHLERATCNEDPLCAWEGRSKQGTCNEAPVCVPTATEEVGVCGDGVDNDCDGLVDCDDTEDCSSYPACNIDCSSFTTKNYCNAQPVCSWSNKQKVCVNN